MKSSYFCPVCGKILEVIQEHGKNMGRCDCGFSREILSLSVYEKQQKEEELGKGVEKEELTQGFPHTCKKCGYGECEITVIGAPYSDESDIYLYKCKKCGHTERQADGTGNN